jgi:hypothetical protein
MKNAAGNFGTRQKTATLQGDMPKAGWHTIEAVPFDRDEAGSIVIFCRIVHMRLQAS